jgi:GAF domain-containing protein
MLLTEDVALDRDLLYQVIGVVAQGPEPERVLPAIADLLSEATGCHACFVYLREGDGLRLRAASPLHARHVGRVAMGLDEGVCGWVATHRAPVLLRDGALDDPRAKRFPELEEERFGSMVAVPLLDRDGAEAIGVVAVHSAAPRELGPEVLDVVAHVAALVAGAIETAGELAAARRQVARLSALAELAQELATAPRREDLYRVACAGVRRLLGADAGRVHVDGAGRLVVERAARLPGEEQRLLAAVGDHLAAALRRAELVERLTAEHLVRDLFDALAEGRPHVAEARARSAGHDLDRPHVIAVLEPLGGEPDPRWPEVAARVEARLRRAIPGALCDPGDERLRVLLPATAPDAPARIDAELDRLAREERLAAGRSEPRTGLAGDQRGLAEATSAAQVARAVEPGGGARGYGALGVYRYLAQLPAGHAPDERHAQAIAALAAYDAKRRTELLRTLERHLGDRGALAATARALYIHTNTLRQRLDRIEALTGLDLATEDLLSLELALKLSRLHRTA